MHKNLLAVGSMIAALGLTMNLYAGVDYLIMSDLPTNAPSRLFLTINFTNNLCLANFTESNTELQSAEIFHQPCNWVRFGDGIFNASLNHDFDVIATSMLRAKQREGLPAQRLTLDGRPACRIVSATGRTNIICSVEGKALLFGSETDVRKEIRQYRVRDGVVRDVESIRGGRQTIYGKTDALGSFMGPETKSFLSAYVPTSWQYDEIALALRAAELRISYSPDYQVETTRLKIEVDTPAHAERIVKDWQAAKDKTTGRMNRLAAEDRLIVERFWPMMNAFGFLLSRLNVVRHVNTIDATIKFDKTSIGYSQYLFYETIKCHSEMKLEQQRKKELSKYKKNDYSYEAVLARANAGDSSSMCLLGSWYQGQAKNPPVKIDYKQAVSWYLKAMAKSNAWGFSKRGVCYEYGLGSEKDGKSAFEHYRMAAILGGGHGMAKVGHCYEKGIGVNKDPAQALKWFLKAAKANNNPYGDAENCRRIASYYEKGLGLKAPNLEEAKKWREKAKAKGK